MKSPSILESKRPNKNVAKVYFGHQKTFRHRDRGLRMGRGQTQ